MPAAALQAPQVPALRRTIDRTIDRARRRAGVRIDQVTVRVQRRIGERAMWITIVVVAVCVLLGAGVLWIAALWTWAHDLAALAPAPAWLFGSAAIHLGTASALAVRQTRRSRLHRLEPPPDAPLPARASTPSRARERRPRPRWPAPYRWLLAGFAVGLALERARRCR
jgi:hypothetical protein